MGGNFPPTFCFALLAYRVISALQTREISVGEFGGRLGLTTIGFVNLYLTLTQVHAANLARDSLRQFVELQATNTLVRS